MSRYMDLALELESEIARLYEAFAEQSGDPSTSARLRSLANEETNHANIIRRGREYYQAFPDLFAGAAVEESEVARGLEDVRSFRASVAKEGVRLAAGLRMLLEFERQFERIHLGASVRIVEPTLKKLFSTLTKADESHILVLKGLIDSLGEAA